MLGFAETYPELLNSILTLHTSPSILHQAQKTKNGSEEGKNWARLQGVNLGMLQPDDYILLSQVNFRTWVN